MMDPPRTLHAFPGYKAFSTTSVTSSASSVVSRNWITGVLLQMRAHDSNQSLCRILLSLGAFGFNSSVYRKVPASNIAYWAEEIMQTEANDGKRKADAKRMYQSAQRQR